MARPGYLESLLAGILESRTLFLHTIHTGRGASYAEECLENCHSLQNIFIGEKQEKYNQTVQTYDPTN